jgi:hypothetical protein
MMSVDVAMVIECRRHFEEAFKLLEKIEDKVWEFCLEKGIDLESRQDDFEPFINAFQTEFLMAFRAYNGSNIGYVVILKDGRITWKECK